MREGKQCTRGAQEKCNVKFLKLMLNLLWARDPDDIRRNGEAFLRIQTVKGVCFFKFQGILFSFV